MFGIAGMASPAQALKCPNVHILMDRSGSMSSTMTTSTGGSSTRWDVAKTQLKGLVNVYDGLSPVGLSIFPPVLGMCNAETPVRPAFYTKTAISAALDMFGPSGSTPTANAVMNVAALSELRDPSRRQYVLLLTDGAPGCSAMDTLAGTVSELQKAYAQSPSISTFVVGIGNLSTSEKAALTQLADAGGRPAPTTDKYYPATNEVELTNSLNTIALMINSENAGCTDALPDGGGGSMDMSMGGMDMSGPPRDMSMPPVDMSGPPRDMAMPPVDMSGPPRDMAMPPVDMSGPPRDMTGPPRDMAGPGPDGGKPGDGRPKIDWILPKEMPFGMGGPAEITGRNFEPTVPTSEFSLEQGVTSIPLNAVLEDSHLARVLIPATLPVGKYTLVVKNPDGFIDALPDAFTVTPAKSGCACSLSPQPVAGTLPVSTLVAGLFAARLLRRRRRAS